MNCYYYYYYYYYRKKRFRWRNVKRVCHLMLKSPSFLSFSYSYTLKTRSRRRLQH